MNISDFEPTRPVFKPEEFLIGRLEGWALIEGPLGGVQKRCSLEAEGRRDGDAVAFTETWTLDDGHADTLNWRIKALGEGRHSGSETHLEGEASGEAAGCAWRWRYTRNVPGEDGSTTKLNFDDWWFLIDENVVMVKGSAGRLGLPFATAYVTYRRVPVASAGPSGPARYSAVSTI